MAKKIYIGKLPGSITDQQLADIFSKIGKVVSVKIIKKISFQESVNYGYVRMESDEATVKAIKTLNNTVLKGSRIKVMEAHYLDQDRPQQYFRNRRSY